MVHTAIKTLLLSPIVFLVVLLIPISATAQYQNAQAELTLQPGALNHVGIYDLRQIEPDLTGTGVKFAVISRSITYIDGDPQNDYRPDIEHNCFKNSQFSFHDQAELPAGISPHSTAICSILLGEDPNAFNPEIGYYYHQGTAPQAEADIYEFWYFLTNNVIRHLPPNADIITVGIGSQFEDWWTRGIESLVEHYGLIVVAAIGNGSEAYDPVLHPGAGANVVGVGVVDSVNTDNLATNLAHFALAYPEHSSIGPTSNGLCKPDLIAPGNCLAADVNEPNRYEPTGNWSSFSTPLVAGTIGLLVQKAKQDPALSPAISQNGGNCVMKAILMNSATKLPYWHKGQLPSYDDHFVPLDYIQGAGMLNAVGAYKLLVAGLNKPGDIPITGWDLNQLNNSETLENIYKITLAEPDNKFITATVVWNRHYKSVYPFDPVIEKDSNLRLELWAIDPDNPNNNYLLDYSDSSVDNVEHIYCQADANYTNYEIIVSYSDIDDNRAVTQRYGLAWKASEKENNDNTSWYDLNADGIVNDSDFIIVLNNVSNSTKSPETYLLGDVNSDGAIDAYDLEVFLNYNNITAGWYTQNNPK